MIEALRNDLGQDVLPLWHNDTDISMFSNEDCIVLPGGFSFGDYLRCGAIARFSPMMQSVIRFANEGGKVLGVCNGFQILCESGLLPGVLLRNAEQQFVCKNVYLKSEIPSGKEVLKIPIAHGDGRFFASESVMNDIMKNNQVLYRYTDENGLMHEDHNPNGAMNNIAGICNAERNVFGMMPHPERACSPHLNNEDGREIFKSLFGIPLINN
jgi:phosphoribosylformylglycinamidine synthase